MTITLRELQENLQAYLLTGDLKIANYIVNPNQDEIDTRLAIYRDGYYLSLLNILKKDFPKLVQLLGEETFTAVGLAYINNYPSRYFSIKDFGQQLPKFLRITQPYCQQLYLAELAEFNWELINTLITANVPLLTTDDLQQIPPTAWGDLRLTLHPSVKLFKQEWNTTAIWQALQQKQTLPSFIQLPTAQFILIWRKGLMPHYSLLTNEAAEIIKAIQAQKTFAEICELLTKWLNAEEVTNYIVNFLKTWLNEGIFASALK